MCEAGDVLCICKYSAFLLVVWKQTKTSEKTWDDETRANWSQNDQKQNLKMIWLRFL